MDNMKKDLGVQGSKDESSEIYCTSVYTASDIDFSINDYDTSVSGVSNGNMIIPYDCIIIEYIFLSNKTRELIINKCCEYNKVEVKQELINFINQPHSVYGSSK